jgi:hypothetical protein
MVFGACFQTSTPRIVPGNPIRTAKKAIHQETRSLHNSLYSGNLASILRGKSVAPRVSKQSGREREHLALPRRGEDKANNAGDNVHNQRPACAKPAVSRGANRPYGETKRLLLDSVFR